MPPVDVAEGFDGVLPGLDVDVVGDEVPPLVAEDAEFGPLDVLADESPPVPELPVVEDVVAGLESGEFAATFPEGFDLEQPIKKATQRTGTYR